MEMTVTIFGSSFPKKGSREYEDAYRLGRLLGSAGINVCSGGYSGIMDAVSKGASEEGVDATGITLSYARYSESAYLTRKIGCNTLFERITNLVTLGDAYIILPGGTGTMLELAVIWEYMNKGLMPLKPAACIGGAWREIVSIMDKRMEAENRTANIIVPFDEYEKCGEYIIVRLKT